MGSHPCDTSLPTCFPTLCLCAWCLPWCLEPSTQQVSHQQPALTTLTAASPLQAMLGLSLPTLLGLFLAPALTIPTAVVLQLSLQDIPTLLGCLLGSVGLSAPTIPTAEHRRYMLVVVTFRRLFINIV